MVLGYSNYLLELRKTVELPDGLPEEVSNSTLIIARSMYDKVMKYSFFKEEDDYFVKFGVSETDFKYIDPSEVLPLDLSVGIMGRRKYYVELAYDDQIPSTSEVVYKIIFESVGS